MTIMNAQSDSVEIDALAQEQDQQRRSSTLVEANKVFIIGDKQVGKSFLLEQLMPSTSSATATPTGTSPVRTVTHSLHTYDLNTQVFHWPIDTRYYSATIEFHVISNENIPPFTPEMSEGLQALTKDCAGIIFLYKHSQPESFENIQRWQTLKELVDDGVFLLVANEVSENSTSSVTAQKAREWAVDRSIEFVSLPHMKSKKESNKTKQKLMDDEEDGIDRIISALHNNIWPVAQLKPRNEPTLSALNESDFHEEDDTLEEEDDEIIDEPTNESALSISQLLASSSANNFTRVTENINEDVLERAMGQFEDIVARMKTVREQSRAGSLTDEQRRKQAADTIMMLMQSMGLDAEEEGLSDLDA